MIQIHQIILVITIVCVHTHIIHSCTTFLVGSSATFDGSVFMAHSNDGDGDTAGNLEIVARQTHEIPSSRKVSGGSIPQVKETFKYLTKVGGYAAINEHQVGLAESTCVAKLSGGASGVS